MIIALDNNAEITPEVKTAQEALDALWNSISSIRNSLVHATNTCSACQPVPTEERFWTFNAQGDMLQVSKEEFFKIHPTAFDDLDSVDEPEDIPI